MHMATCICHRYGCIVNSEVSGYHIDCNGHVGYHIDCDSHDIRGCATGLVNLNWPSCLRPVRVDKMFCSYIVHSFEIKHSEKEHSISHIQFANLSL